MATYISKILRRVAAPRSKALRESGNNTAAVATVTGDCLKKGDNVSELNNDAGYITSAQASSAFVATYGSTTFAELTAAKAAGQPIFLSYNGAITSWGYYDDSTEFVWLRVNDPTAGVTSCRVIRCKSTDSWDTYDVTLGIDNEVSVVTYGFDSYATVLAAYQAHKKVFCERSTDGGYMYLYELSARVPQGKSHPIYFEFTRACVDTDTYQSWSELVRIDSSSNWSLIEGASTPESNIIIATYGTTTLSELSNTWSNSTAVLRVDGESIGMAPVSDFRIDATLGTFFEFRSAPDDAGGFKIYRLDDNGWSTTEAGPFLATYGTTTYDELNTAAGAGRQIILSVNGQKQTLPWASEADGFTFVKPATPSSSGAYYTQDGTSWNTIYF